MLKRSVRCRAILLCAACLPFAVGAVAWAAEKLKVIEREAAIRREKKNWSPRLAVVGEGEEVTVLAREELWLRVERNGVEGWMTASSVTDDPKAVFSTDAVAKGTRATEQSSASRGFDEVVEKEYRNSHPDLNAAFQLLDQIQKKQYPEDQVVQFLKDGRLADFAAGGSK